MCDLSVVKKMKSVNKSNCAGPHTRVCGIAPLSLISLGHAKRGLCGS